MTDTLKTIIDTVQVNTNNSIDLIQKVDSFYNNAWDKLIIFGSVIFAIVGIAVPIAIQWYQKKTLKLSEDQLKNKIISDLSTKIEEKFNEYEKKIKLLIASAEAKPFLLQGKLNLEKNYYQTALSEFIAASSGFIEGDDYQKLQEALKLILNDCLPNLSLEEINDLKIANDSDLNLFLSQLKEKDNKGIFTTTIQEIKLKLTKIPKTIKEKPQEQPKA